MMNIWTLNIGRQKERKESFLWHVPKFKWHIPKRIKQFIDILRHQAKKKNAFDSRLWKCLIWFLFHSIFFCHIEINIRLFCNCIDYKPYPIEIDSIKIRVLILEVHFNAQLMQKNNKNSYGFLDTRYVKFWKNNENFIRKRHQQHKRNSIHWVLTS